MEVCRCATPHYDLHQQAGPRRPAADGILADIEDKLQIECAPLYLADRHGKDFKGVYNPLPEVAPSFTPGGQPKGEGITITDLEDPRLDELLGSQAERLREEIALIEGAANPFPHEEYLKGNQTPVFFGSAINNFGVRELLDAFRRWPRPGPRPTTTRMVSAAGGGVLRLRLQDPGEYGSGPPRPDRLLPDLLGEFTRGKGVSPPDRPRDRPLQRDDLHGPGPTNVEEAWPGDIIGIHNHGTIQNRRHVHRRRNLAVHRSPISHRSTSGASGLRTRSRSSSSEGTRPALGRGGRFRSSDRSSATTISSVRSAFSSST